MKMINSLCYREIIKDIVSSRKGTSSHVSFQDIAENVRMPKSYISKVMNGKADFNPDQLYLVCKYLCLDTITHSYLELLLDYSRCSLQIRKHELIRNIQDFQEQHLTTENHINADENPLSTQDLMIYYLDPMHQVVHVSLDLPHIGRDYLKLIDLLGLEESRLREIVTNLESMRLISLHNGKVSLVQKSIHLPKTSPIYRPWLSQLKLLSLERLDKTPVDDKYSFSVLFSASDDVRKSIKSKFLDFLSSIEKEVKDSDPQHSLQMSFELFKWV